MNTANKLPKKEKRASWPLIRKCSHRNGTETWMVDGRIGGKGPRSFHKSKVEAQTVAEQLRVQRKNEGVSAFAMSPTDRADASAALAELQPHGFTLREATRFFLKHVKVVRRKLTLAQAVDEYIAVRVADGIAPHTFYHTRAFLRRVTREFPRLNLLDVSTAMLDDWLRDPKHAWAPPTRNQNRRLLGGLFTWAVKRDYLVENPVTKVAVATVIEKRPGMLKVHEVRKLLAAADPNILPCLLLGVFAGLRPQSEVLRLDWSDINFEAERIEINKSKIRSAQHRNVAMSANLVEWLLPFRRPGGLVGPCEATYNKRLQETRMKAGIREWPKDVLRHTYGSMHLEEWQSADKTALQMGHKSTVMLFKHYRERVTPEEAKSIWSILPDVGSNIISMAEYTQPSRLRLAVAMTHTIRAAH